MIRSFNGTVTCQHCGRRTSAEDDFGQWVRATCGNLLSVNDVDYIVHRFTPCDDRRGQRIVQYLMLVEKKTHCAQCQPAQRDTLVITDQLLRTQPRRGHRERNGRFRSGIVNEFRPVQSTFNGGSVLVISFGVHLLRLEGTRPDDGGWITWDHKPVSESQLVMLMRFDLNPDSLRPMEHRRRKRGVKQTGQLPMMFD